MQRYAAICSNMQQLIPFTDHQCAVQQYCIQITLFPPDKIRHLVDQKPQNRQKIKSERGRKQTRPDVSFGPHESPCKISGQSIENSPNYGLQKLLKGTGQFFYQEKHISGWNKTTKIGQDLPNILMGKVRRFGVVLANGLEEMANFRRLVFF